MQDEPADDHAQFVEAVRREPYWTVVHAPRAFYLAWGPVGAVLFWLAEATSIAAPLAALVKLAAAAHNFWILAWAPVAVLVARMADRTALGSLVAMFFFLVVGLPLFFFSGRLQLLAAFVPVGAFFVATLLRVAIMRAFMRRLARSRAAWQRVHDEGLLLQR